MKRLYLAVALLSISGVSANILAPNDLPDLVEKIMPGVVNISATSVIRQRSDVWNQFFEGFGIPRDRKQSSLGSGLIIDSEGMVITNNHVIQDADEVIVTLKDKRTFRAKIIGKDKKLDIALLQIRDKGQKTPANILPLALGDSDKVRVAESVIAIGSPFGLQHTVTTGIISAKNRTIGMGPLDNFLQTDASINPGNSGGPLFNLKGEVIGVNTLIFSNARQSAGVGFSIPINEVKKVLESLKRHGHVLRPWLGIVAETVTPALQEYYGLGASQGVIIFNLVLKGPAHRAKLNQGDIIVGIEQKEITAPDDLERILYTKKVGDSIKVQINRGRKKLSVNLILQELPNIENLPEGIL